MVHFQSWLSPPLHLKISSGVPLFLLLALMSRHSLVVFLVPGPVIMSRSCVPPFPFDSNFHCWFGLAAPVLQVKMLTAVPSVTFCLFMSRHLPLIRIVLSLYGVHFCALSELLQAHVIAGLLSAEPLPLSSRQSLLVVLFAAVTFDSKSAVVPGFAGIVVSAAVGADDGAAEGADEGALEGACDTVG